LFTHAELFQLNYTDSGEILSLKTQVSFSPGQLHSLF